MILEVLREGGEAMQFFTKSFKDKYDVKLSGKIQSETFSNLLEQISARVFSKHLGYEIKKANSDNNPDLFFTKINMPMEIKVTSGQVWRGGEFSKRASWHLMVSRSDEFDEFFVCLVEMKGENDLWISAMQRGKDYYAPSFKKDQIYELKNNQTMLIKESSAPYGEKINQPKIYIFVGDVVKPKNAVKLVREKV
ncbi:MAG: hypothetical protein ABIA56_02625 [Actinomycetota bacterium]